MIFKIFILILTFLLILPLHSLHISSHKQQHTLYKDNLSAQNWYYGTISPLDYRVRIFKAATTQTLSACPLSTPYMSVDMNTCTSCPVQKPLRNLGSYTCQVCPNGQAYDQNVGNCSSTSTGGSVGTGVGGVGGASVVPTITQTVDTPGSGPGSVVSNYTIMPTVVSPTSSVPSSASGVNAVNTTSGNVYYYTFPNGTISQYYIVNGSAVFGTAPAGTTSTTSTTPSTTTTTPTTPTTTTTSTTTTTTVIPTTTVTNTSTSTVIPLVYNNSQTPTTPTTTPTTTNTTVVQPTTTTTPTTTTPTTTVTPTTTNTTDNYAPVIVPTPIPMPTPTPVVPVAPTTNTTIVTPTTPVTPVTPVTPITPVIPAPVSPSDFIGNLTHNCTKSVPFYNTTTKKCQACPSGTQFINTTQVCLPIIYVANLDKATNLIQPYANYSAQQTQAIKAQHPTRTVQPCPANTPFLSVMNKTSGRICVSCPDKQYFAVATQKCISSCPPGTIYNTTQKLCQVGSYLTNPQSPNLISPTLKYQQWKKSIQNQKLTGVNIQYCPSNTPYQMNNQCSTCTGGTPYFDIENKVCVSCGTGRYYSYDDKRCISSFSGSMSLQRMVANIL